MWLSSGPHALVSHGAITNPTGTSPTGSHPSHGQSPVPRAPVPRAVTNMGPAGDPRKQATPLGAQPPAARDPLVETGRD